MDCKGIGSCTYRGPAKVGRFGYDKFYRKQVFIRCPRCKHIFPREDELDQVRKELRFRSKCMGKDYSVHPPVRRKMIFSEFDDWGLVKYTISCPECSRGWNGVLTMTELRMAKRYAEKYKVKGVEFPNVNCWTCQHKKVMKNCRFYVKGLVGACKGRKAEMEGRLK